MAEDALIESLIAVLGDRAVVSGDDVNPDDVHDESLAAAPGRPRCVLRPTTSDQVIEIVQICARHGVPIVARGSGTGLSGASVAVDGCALIAFDSMKQILEIDADNHVAVVQPGVTLAQLADALEGSSLTYPIHPGERSGSIGGNVSTNAGGMRAVRDGVTRHHVLGLELVLADGSRLRTGGKIVKLSTGYDLTQLVIGSEGTLALVTEITLKLSPRWPESATLLAPFPTLASTTEAVPHLIASGLSPAVLEYLDLLTLASVTAAADLELGIPEEVTTSAEAYLVVVLESTDPARLEQDVEAMATKLAEQGAMDTYVLPPAAGHRLIEAREQAFYVAKANGATEIVDVVVPRAEVASYLADVGKIAQEHETFVVGCGHVGDGNVHLSVLEADEAKRDLLVHALLAAGIAHGGDISGEHGIGTAKLAAYLELADPLRLDLEARIKEAFDPHCLLNPARSLKPRSR